MVLPRIASWLALASLLAVNAAPRLAAACDPAPNYQAELVAQDTLGCLTVSAVGDYDAAYLSVANDCSLDVTISAGDDCPDCPAAVIVQPGTSARYQIDASGEGGRRTILWADAESSGTITIDVGYHDNSGACSGSDDGFGNESDEEGADGGGCSVAVAPARGRALGPILFACVAVAGLHRRARTRRASRSRER